MNSGRIKVIVLDVDGCLGPGKCLPYDLEAFIKIREWITSHSGLPVILCTGRSQPYAESILQILGSYHRGFPSIVENGCYLYFPHKEEDYIRANPAMEELEDHLLKLKTILYKAISEDGKVEPGKEVCLSINPLQRGDMKGFYERIIAMIPQSYRSLVHTTHSSSAVDITPRGVHKGNALEFLSEVTGVPVEHMLGVGDTLGDIEMLTRVGVPTCPANATEEVKRLVTERGGYIAQQSEAEGVYQILTSYCFL